MTPTRVRPQHPRAVPRRSDATRAPRALASRHPQRSHAGDPLRMVLVDDEPTGDRDPRETDRRRAERHQENFPVSLVFEESVGLHGRTLDWSSHGVLLETTGRLSVQVHVEGHTYRGQLVRAFPGDSGTTACGIELLDPLALAKAI